MTESPSTVAAGDAREAEAFLAAHPGIDTIELLIGDNIGIFRGKTVAREGLLEVYREGVRLPGSIFTCLITGASSDEAGQVWETGDADHICRPIPGTLVPVPWRERPTAQLLMTMDDQAGGPFFADPRQVLARVAARLVADGLHPDVAFELEFYLIDRELDADGRPQAAVAPASGRRQRTIQVYGMVELAEFEALLGDVAAAARVQGVPAETAVSEYAPSQYEINLDHVTDPLAAADHALLLKRLVKEVAGRHGVAATFLSKPFPGQAGNGMHLHVSLRDANGRNLFAARDRRGSRALRHAIGGLVATMGEAMAFFAPNLNAFRRFEAGSYAPLAPTWGVDNRTVALRIPIGPPEGRRVEHRVAGADANPYLVLAAVLAGMHHGIERALDPGPVNKGNAYKNVPPSLPTSWEDALDALEAAEILPAYFDPAFLRAYRITKDEERRYLARTIAPVEYDWFLRVG